MIEEEYQRKYVIWTLLAVVLVGATAATANDNARIAFVSDRDGNGEIYVMKADGTDQTRLTNNSADDSRPAYSPNGSRIAFMSHRDGNIDPKIYLMNADGTNAVRLTIGTAHESSPGWSPDGSKIAYVHNYERINVINSDGTGQTTIYQLEPGDDTGLSSLDWSPEGTKILFDMGANVFTVNSAGGVATQVEIPSRTFEWFFSPSWSNDGARLVVSFWFESIFDASVENGLKTANIDGSNVQMVRNTGGGSPDWSASGLITFADGGPFTTYSDIFVIRPDGSGLLNLTNSPSAEYDPSWAPASPVSISGRVTTPTGSGLRNAIISITNSQNVTRTQQTSSLGFYTFDNVQVGGTYTIRVVSKRFRFGARSLQVNDTLANLDFIGEE